MEWETGNINIDNLKVAFGTATLDPVCKHFDRQATFGGCKSDARLNVGWKSVDVHLHFAGFADLLDRVTKFISVSAVQSVLIDEPEAPFLSCLAQASLLIS